MRKQKDDLKSSQKHPKKTQKRQNEASEDDSVREKVEDNIIKVQPDNEKTEEYQISQCLLLFLKIKENCMWCGGNWTHVKAELKVNTNYHGSYRGVNFATK